VHAPRARVILVDHGGQLRSRPVGVVSLCFVLRTQFGVDFNLVSFVVADHFGQEFERELG